MDEFIRTHPSAFSRPGITSGNGISLRLRLAISLIPGCTNLDRSRPATVLTE